MEQTIRLILLAVGAIIVLWILYDGIKRQKRLRGEGNIITNNIDESERDSSEKMEYAFESIEEHMPNLDVVAEIEEDEIKEYESKKNVFDGISDDKNNVVEEVVMLMIVPEKEQVFSGGVLLQTLFSHDLHFGDQQIFHYYSMDSNNLDKPLFSVASASASGEFDLNSMRENSYRGLVAFMEPARHLHPTDVFDMMVKVAGNLAADLQGKLLSGDQQPWSDEVAAEIRAAI